MCGSLDVVSLYPSLDQEGSATAVEEFVMNNGVTTDGIDIRAAQIYLCSNLSESQIKSEGLSKLLPKRRWKFGNRPGPTTLELGLKRPPPGSGEPEPASKWAPMDVSMFSQEEKLLLMSKVCKVATRVVFENHQYMFNGQTFIQSSGAPIGLDNRRGSLEDRRGSLEDRIWSLEDIRGSL